jgi:Acetyltransferases
MIITDLPIAARSAKLLAQLTELWRQLVTATHDFLTAAEIDEIALEVPEAIANIPTLLVATDDAQQPQAFLGLADQEIAMLFVAPAMRGYGVGRQLITCACDQYGAVKLTVNEQNPQARGFYEHLGFQVTARQTHDDQGRPYPILVMTKSQTTQK